MLTKLDQKGLHRPECLQIIRSSIVLIRFTALWRKMIQASVGMIRRLT